MWNNALTCALRNQPWHTLSLRRSSSVSYAVDSAILRSLKDHYLDATKTSPPPKMDPPEPFEVVKGAMEGNSPVLRRSYGRGEDIRVSAARSATIHGGVDGDEDDLSEVLLHVEVLKPKEDESLHFLCGLYPDALGIHSVFMSPKTGDGDSASPVMAPTAYNGPNFRDLDERMRDMFHNYIEERGLNESLFPFLQVWLYVKDHRKTLRWFKSVGMFIRGKKPSNDV